MFAAVITTEGVCLNDEEKHQIEESNVVWDAGDDGSDGSTAQSASGLRGTPPSAIVRATPEFIWEISVMATLHTQNPIETSENAGKIITHHAQTCRKRVNERG